MKKLTGLLVLAVWGLIIVPASGFTATIDRKDAYITPDTGTLMGGLGCFVGGEVPGQYDWTIGNCVPGGVPTDDMVFSTKDTTGWQERMRITKEGNVGIGTTNPLPTSKLDIYADSAFSNIPLTVRNDSRLGPMVKLRGGNATIQKEATDGSNIWTWWTEVVGGAAPKGRFRIYDYTNGREVFTISSNSGNVGIGTTMPNYKLDVEGDVQAHAYHTGDIFFQKDGEELWRMFEDEEGLYLESLKTGKVYRFMLQEVVGK